MSDKSNKFNEQNKNAEDRKTADSPRQGEPMKEPNSTETSAKPEATPEKK